MLEHPAQHLTLYHRILNAITAMAVTGQSYIARQIFLHNWFNWVPNRRFIQPKSWSCTINTLPTEINLLLNRKSVHFTLCNMIKLVAVWLFSSNTGTYINFGKTVQCFEWHLFNFDIFFHTKFQEVTADSLMFTKVHKLGTCDIHSRFQLGECLICIRALHFTTSFRAIANWRTLAKLTK